MQNGRKPYWSSDLQVLRSHVADQIGDLIYQYPTFSSGPLECMADRIIMVGFFFERGARQFDG